MNLGAHVSISGGMDKAIERGTAMGATCIQTFASPPRTLKFFPYDDQQIERYKTARSHSPISLHVFHAVYLVNLASEKPDYLRASIESLENYQQLAGQLGAIGTIFHIGSHKGLGFDAVKLQVGKAIAEVTHATPSDAKIIIENAAGHAGTVGQTTEELAFVFDEVEKAGGEMSRVGLCLDTQHAFANGVDARDAHGLDIYLQKIDHQIGLSYLQVIHTNDSKVEAGSHKDRHENIGDGCLGSVGISHWLNHPKLTHLPFILEVPGLKKDGPGRDDLERLRQLVV